MRPLRIAGLILMIAVFLSVSSMHAQTQSDLDEQACGQFHKTDVAMNEIYSRVLKEYAKDGEFIAKLKMAQKAWTAFRDAQLEALFPKAKKQAEYGTVYPMCHCNDLQTLTEERTRQLKVWVDGIPEGDVCTGSVKITRSDRPLGPSGERSQQGCGRTPQTPLILPTNVLTRTY
jgi:uncharacterized protein YecT (DUF1311 family)